MISYYIRFKCNIFLIFLNVYKTFITVMIFFCFYMVLFMDQELSIQGILQTCIKNSRDLKSFFLYLFLFEVPYYASLEIYILRIFSLVIFIVIISGNLEIGLKSAESFPSPFLVQCVFWLTCIFTWIKEREKEEICSYCSHITYA